MNQTGRLRSDFRSFVALVASGVAHCLMIVLLAGCGGSSPAAGSLQPEPNSDGGDAVEADETWFALYIGDDLVGYQHTLRRNVQRDSREVVEIDREHFYRLLRFERLVQIRLSTHVVETPDERVIRFESTANLGTGDLKLTGRVEGGRLHSQVKSPGGTQVESIPWSDAPCGTMAWENSLAANPPQPGEKRTLKMLDIGPERGKLVDVELQAEQYEPTELLEETRSLLRLRVATSYPGQPDTLKFTAWCDEQGNVLKTEFPFLDTHVTALAVSRERALAEAPPPQVDIGFSATVKVDRQIANPHAARRIVYEAHLPDGDPSRAFPATAAQTVEKIDEHTARITVTALRPVAGPAPPAAAANPADLAPGALIESDAPEVAALAGSVLPGQRDPWTLAVALESLVHEHVTNRNFSTALATAAETARTKEGDCTEHAMLLAAVCRARKIPARVAIGLVYVDPPNKPKQRGFAYHMWTEVSINGEWIPIDATLGRGGVGAAHLTVVETNFSDAGIDAFLPVFNVIGKLELKVVDVEPADPP